MSQKLRRLAAVQALQSPQQLVESYAARLLAAGADARAFDAVFDALQAETSLKLTHIATIAQRYAPGSKRPASKTLAFAAISKRFVAVVKDARPRRAG